VGGGGLWQLYRLLPSNKPGIWTVQTWHLKARNKLLVNFASALQKPTSKRALAREWRKLKQINYRSIREGLIEPPLISEHRPASATHRADRGTETPAVDLRWSSSLGWLGSIWSHPFIGCPVRRFSFSELAPRGVRSRPVGPEAACSPTALQWVRQGAQASLVRSRPGSLMAGGR
jgi:hypothetical protein